MPGFESQTLLLNAIRSRIVSLITANNAIFTIFPSLFRNGEINTGTKHQHAIRYSYTSNAAAMSSYADPAVTPDSSASVIAEINKTSYQGSILTYDVLKAMNTGIGKIIEDDLGLALDNNQELMICAEQLRSEISSTIVGELESQIDSAGNVYDNTLSRATYGLASKEVAAGSLDLTTDMLDECIEYTKTTAGGAAPVSDLVWLSPVNQTTKLASISTANQGTEIHMSNKSMISDAQNDAPIDAGRIYRTRTYNSIPWVEIPEMTSTNILLVRKSVVEMLPWQPMTYKDKSASIAALQEFYILWTGMDIRVINPARCAKISGLAA